MMAEVEYGIVKFFDDRNGKKYGFILVLDANRNKTGEEIFFHYNDGEFCSHDGSEVIFGGHTQTVDNRSYPLATPYEDAEIVFERTVGKENKPKACPWAYADDWLNESTLLSSEQLTEIDESEYEGLHEGEEDETVSVGTVYGRALHCFGGNTELAREAAQMYPGDFI